ncbi:hypothetical protein FB645_001866 [Coemansia sp. IMI 203386]|nr:hypothetical protein FB645_001866 [Coemansia sp. IMI 203386]
MLQLGVLALPAFDKRVIGGWLLQSELAVSSISLVSRINGGGVKCGGTLISPRHVITVGHCVITETGMTAGNDQVKVYYGNPNIGKAKSVQSTKVTYYPTYYSKQTGRDSSKDLAIIEIPEIKLDSKTVDRAVIFDGSLVPGQLGLVVGWGGAEKGANLSLLRAAYSMVGEPKDCGIKDNNGPTICLPGDLTPGMSACAGDSGSGMFLNDGGLLKLIGFDSVVWGPGSCGGKGRKHSFVNAHYYMDFIEKTTGLTSDYLTGTE